jgi:hypothetical protein
MTEESPNNAGTRKIIGRPLRSELMDYRTPVNYDSKGRAFFDLIGLKSRESFMEEICASVDVEDHPNSTYQTNRTNQTCLTQSNLNRILEFSPYSTFWTSLIEADNLADFNTKIDRFLDYINNYSDPKNFPDKEVGQTQLINSLYRLKAAVNQPYNVLMSTTNPLREVSILDQIDTVSTEVDKAVYELLVQLGTSVVLFLSLTNTMRNPQKDIFSYSGIVVLAGTIFVNLYLAFQKSDQIQNMQNRSSYLLSKYTPFLCHRLERDSVLNEIKTKYYNNFSDLTKLHSAISRFQESLDGSSTEEENRESFNLYEKWRYSTDIERANFTYAELGRISKFVDLLISFVS